MTTQTVSAGGGLCHPICVADCSATSTDAKWPEHCSLSAEVVTGRQGLQAGSTNRYGKILVVSQRWVWKPCRLYHRGGWVPQLYLQKYHPLSLQWADATVAPLASSYSAWGEPWSALSAYLNRLPCGHTALTSDSTKSPVSVPRKGLQPGHK